MSNERSTPWSSEARSKRLSCSERDSDFVRGVNSAKGPDPSVGLVPVVTCPDVDNMEEEVQVSVQVEVERVEQGIGETNGKEQGEEQRVKERTLRRTTWMTMEMT